jgi:hypothetical protein
MLFRFFIAVVVLLAGGYRLLDPNIAKRERQYLNLPSPYSTYLVSALEILVGIALLTLRDPSSHKIIYLTLIGFMTVGLIRLSYYNLDSIVKTTPDIFIIHPTFTNFFLHITYLVILIHLVW